MKLRILPVTIAVLFATALAAVAQSPGASTDHTGVLTRVDERSSVVIFDDGRAFRVTPGTAILVEGMVAEFGALRPGRVVTLRAAEPVVFRDGQYVRVTEAGAPSASPAYSVRTRVYGTVKDTDRDGDVKIATDHGEFRVRVAPDVAARIREGDVVTVDVLIAPPAPRVR
jgi:hypothetical protein